MVRRIERGEANAILSWKLDRIARNFDDGGKVIGLLQRGVIQEIRTFEKSYLPADNVLMIAVEFGMANQYSRDLTINVSRGLREKIRRGIFPSKAPLGYFNEPRLRTIEPLPRVFPKVKRILELFATGEYSTTGIQREMVKVRLFGTKGQPPHLSTINKMLRNPFYYGAFYYTAELHQGAHVPMISKETFDRIQAALVTHGKPRKRRQKDKFLFLDFATCGSCGFSITAERHIKKSGLRFDYYRCTHKNKAQPCEDRTYVSEKVFAEEVRRNVELVTLPDEWKEKFLARIETWEGSETTARLERVNRLKAELADLKAKVDRINNAFTENALGIAEFKELKNPLVAKRIGLEREIDVLEDTSLNRLEPLKNFVLEANTAEKWLFEDNWPELKNFLKKVGSNRLLRAQTVTVGFKKPWNLLSQTISSARERDPKNPKGYQPTEMCTRGDSNSHGFPHTHLKRARLPFRHECRSFTLAAALPLSLKIRGARSARISGSRRGRSCCRLGAWPWMSSRLRSPCANAMPGCFMVRWWPMR